MTMRADRFFFLLGSVVFVLGWIGTIYLIFDTGDHQASILSVYGGSSQGRVWLAIQNGTLVIISAGILWGVGALIGSRYPDRSDEA